MAKHTLRNVVISVFLIVLFVGIIYAATGFRFSTYNVPSDYVSPTDAQLCADKSANDNTFAWGIDEFGACSISGCHAQPKYDEWVTYGCNENTKMLIQSRNYVQYVLPNCEAVFDTQFQEVPQDWCAKCPAPTLIQDWAFEQTLGGKSVYSKTVSAPIGSDCVPTTKKVWKFTNQNPVVSQPNSQAAFDPFLWITVIIVVIVAIVSFWKRKAIMSAFK